MRWLFTYCEYDNFEQYISKFLVKEPRVLSNGPSVFLYTSILIIPMPEQLNTSTSVPIFVKTSQNKDFPSSNSN